jgi:tetratricopeptide (TPR) repeat protein
VDEAIACFRKTIELDPNLATAHFHLGITLAGKGQVDEASASFRRAIALDPKDAHLHFNLGKALYHKGKVDEAVTCFRNAIALDPKYTDALTILGAILCDVKRDYDGAIACFRQAIVLNPKDANLHFNLGNALDHKGKVDEAVASFRQALALDPKDYKPHAVIGRILCNVKRDYDGAIACFRKAVALDPKNANLHFNLGVALSNKGQLDEAIASYQKALTLDPRFAPARSGLADAERLAARRKLAAFLKGDFKPTTNKDRLGLAVLCTKEKRYRASAGLYADAFAAEPKLADDRKADHRYNAACMATLAAGQGEDAARPDDKEQERLRRQALDWLRADLDLRTRQVQSAKPADRAAVQQALRRWQKDADLSGIRDKEALAKLPAEEQKSFTQLWADVAALLKNAQTPAKKEGK